MIADIHQILLKNPQQRMANSDESGDMKLLGTVN